MARRLAQAYFILTTLSGIVMGMNCVLFCFCVYVLWGQNRKILLLCSAVQFVLCIVQVSLFSTYLTVAFTHYLDAESYFEHIIVYSLPCYLIYLVNYAIEAFLLIWRIYVLYNYNIVWCIPSIVLLALQIGIGGVTAKGFATEAVISGPLRAFNLTTWVLMAAVNISATVLICVRLWIAHQRTHAILSQSKYKSTIILVVECGALVTFATIAVLILQAVIRPGALAGVGLMTQIGTIVPLLIIARHGILGRRSVVQSFAPQIPLRISVVRTEVTHVDAPVAPTRKIRRFSACLPAYGGGSYPKPFRDVADPLAAVVGVP